MSIASTAVIGHNVSLGKNIKIGCHTLIKDNVIIGDNVVIEDFCIINENVQIKSETFVGPYSILGEKHASYYQEPFNYKNKQSTIGLNSIIRSHSIIYADVEIGDYFQTGHRVTIREGALIGHHTRIGTLCDIQGDCRIGNYVSLHSNVFIAQKSVIKDYVWLFPHVILTNDPTPPSENIMGSVIESFAVVAAGSVILPGIHIGENSLVGAQSLVREDVASKTVVVGNPAKEIYSIYDVKNKVTGEKVYPWQEHFLRGMPWANIGYDRWLIKEK